MVAALHFLDVFQKCGGKGADSTFSDAEDLRLLEQPNDSDSGDLGVITEIPVSLSLRIVFSKNLRVVA